MLKLSQPNISEAGIRAVTDVLRSGQLVHGPESEAFEEELADYLGCAEVVLVSSGTAALHLALMSLDIGPGDAVIVPDFTFPATANSVVMVGAKPIIVDVDMPSYTLSTEKLASVIRHWNGPEQLKAIIPVHEFGCLAQMEIISSIARPHNLMVIEDAACALGAYSTAGKAGTLGDIGCFSFHPRKTLTTGEGGALAIQCPQQAQRLRSLRNHGTQRTPTGIVFIEPATNYRLTNFQAALGRSQLAQLDDWIQIRVELVATYHSMLRPLEDAHFLSLPPMISGHSWQTFMVVLDAKLDRNHIIQALRERGIEANLGAQSLSAIGIYDQYAVAPEIGPVLYARGLALPLFEQMSMSDIRNVCNALIQIIQY